MNSIPYYIARFLQQGNRLVLSGFGVFTPEIVPSRLDPVTHTFHPMGMSIRFYPDARHEDDALPSFISEHSGISAENATELVASFVNDLNVSLKSSPVAEVEDLGTFQYNIEKRLVFIAAEELLAHPDSFGLQPVSQQPVTVRTREEATQQAGIMVGRQKLVSDIGKPRKKWLFWIVILLLATTIAVLLLWYFKVLDLEKLLEL
ncbi:MAG: hypothetical protein KKA07_14265 [Bacteroidetes bacterium]|nr:hypothetical protein [Bacteroidota bacterium]MBU1720227.1 hypothetical protein [Bacteroidota bacterium]